MGILQQAKEKAATAAREAADATARAAARANDPETRERMKSGLASAGHAAGEASRAAAAATSQAAHVVAVRANDPETQARVRSGMKAAGSGVMSAGRTTATGVRKAGRTMIERIDPGILAEVVIKATALQEKTNNGLRARGSVYRIGELQISASLPPGISFGIVRIDDPEHPLGGGVIEARTSTELLAERAEADGVASLDPDEPDEALLIDEGDASIPGDTGTVVVAGEALPAPAEGEMLEAPSDDAEAAAPAPEAWHLR